MKNLLKLESRKEVTSTIAGQSLEFPSAMAWVTLGSVNACISAFLISILAKNNYLFWVLLYNEEHN